MPSRRLCKEIAEIREAPENHEQVMCIAEGVSTFRICEGIFLTLSHEMAVENAIRIKGCC